MYHEIGAFDAKAKLSELLRKIEQGERFTITLRGKPIADLIPSHMLITATVHSAIENIQRMQKIEGVTAADVAAFITEGRE